MERVTRARLYHAWTWGNDMRIQGVAFMCNEISHAVLLVVARCLGEKISAIAGHFSAPFDDPGTILRWAFWVSQTSYLASGISSLLRGRPEKFTIPPPEGHARL